MSLEHKNEDEVIAYVYCVSTLFFTPHLLRVWVIKGSNANSRAMFVPNIFMNFTNIGV